MITVEEITEAILRAKGYQAELTEELLEEQKAGCMDCKDQRDINRIENLVVSLENRIVRFDLGEDTTKLYNCLLLAIGNYHDGALSIDPNATVPSIIIDVEVITDSRPNELTFYWSDLIDNGEDGRVRYENPLIKGWTPMIVIGDVDKHLLKFRDFIPLEDGGFELVNTGNVPSMFNGQVGWIVGYEPYATPEPTYPSAGTYRLVNNSSIDTSYFISSSIPLVSGQTVNAAFSFGDTLIGSISNGEKLNFTRYLSDGTVDLTLELTNPPSTQLSTSIMDQNKSYEFIYTDYQPL